MTFVLIGGRTNKEKLDNKIERHILSLTKKTKPRILFCGFATMNSIEKTNQKFSSLMEDISCEITYMKLSDINRFEELLTSHDVFYVAGGVSDDLIDVFQKNHLDEILKRHLNDDIIFSGISAGAMLYCNSAMGDKDVYTDGYKMYNFKMVKALGFLNINMCPHYNNPDLICYNDEIRKYNMPCFGIENDTALVVNDDSYYIFKENKKMSVYYFDFENNYKMIDLKEGVVYEKDCCTRS